MSLPRPRVVSRYRRLSGPSRHRSLDSAPKCGSRDPDGHQSLPISESMQTGLKGREKIAQICNTFDIYQLPTPSTTFANFRLKMLNARNGQ